ncbi:helix-turn-helix domain-containing protein [Treponema bryantii]|uniref:helix-turn-helix domain-containing protein n=1 Tax=Treponema bryantii TaxID=163 RepID=UPI0003B4AC49|nr:helix-turn-helix transcriptional regulator [Treponema bryantii]
MGFRENLKEEMEYQGITTKELAEKSGVGKRTIDHYLMTNPQEPGVYNAQKIAKALKVSVEYLVTGTEYKNSIVVTGDKLELFNSFDKLSAEDKVLIIKLAQKLRK